MFKERFNNFRSSLFARNLITLQSGTMAGTLIQAGAGILLARVLQPSLFGIYSLAFGLASILVIAGIPDVVSTLAASAYARNDKSEVGNILAFLVKITIITGTVSLIIVLFGPLISDYFYGNAVIGAYAIVLVAGVFIANLLFSPLKIILQVSGSIKSLARATVYDASFRSLISLALAAAGFGVLGAVGGHFIGALAVFFVSVFMWRKIQPKFLIFPELGKLWRVWRKVKVGRYLKYTFWALFDKNIADLYFILPVVLTGIYVAPSNVTFFKLAFGYVNLALSLLGPVGVLLNVEFPKIHVADKTRLRSNFIKVSLYSLGLSLALTAGAVAVSPWVFKILYGESFLPSVSYVYGLLAYGALMGIGVGLGAMWRAINQIKTSIKINLITLAAGIPLGLWLIRNYGLKGSVLMVTIWFTVSHLISFSFLLFRLRNLPESTGVSA